MKNFGKKLGAMALALVMAFGLLTTVQFGVIAQGEKLLATTSASFSAQSVQPAAVKTGDDGTTNWDFIEPVTHKKSVPSGYTAISTAAQLNAVRNNLNKNYILMANIDLSGWGNWVPIGDFSPYTGIFDGNGYVIQNMTVTVEGSSWYVYAGLFGNCSGGEIKNLGLSGGKVSVSASKEAISFAGGIVGDTASRISNCYNTGSVSASASDYCCSYAGGIAGNSYALISNCYNMGEVTALASSPHADAYAGGISGIFSAISNCYNTGTVRASLSDVTVHPVAATSDACAGGIAGVSTTFSSAPSIKSCYNTGTVSASAAASANACAGGIAGRFHDSASTSNCYNTGSVSASASSLSYTGGIAGRSYSSSSISKCYNTGTVKGASKNSDASVGGVVGDNSYKSTVTNCYYRNNTAKAAGESDGGITNVRVLTATRMKQQASFSGFDFSKVWTMASNGYPQLRSLTTHTHSFSAWKTTKAATCKATGTQTRTCSFCNKTETKTLAKLTTHKAGAWVTTVKATTTKAGKQTQKCTVCSKVLATKTLPANHTIKLNASKATLGKGETYTLKATTSVKTTVKWTTSNAKAATVSSAGVVKAVAPGSATITATTAGGRTAKFAVTVKAAPTSVKLSRSSVTLGVKESYTPSVSFNPSDAASYKRSWSSSNKAVATVDAKGKITAVKAGKATITVTTFNGKKASVVVTVKAAPSSVKLSSTKLTLNKGKTATLKATLAPSGAASFAKSWTSSNAKIAKVDANGKVTAVAKGTATISYKTFNGKTAKCVVTVK